MKEKERRNFPSHFLFLGSGGQGDLNKGTRDLFASRINVCFSFFPYLLTVQLSSSQKRNLACFGGKVLAGKSELLRRQNFGPILPGEYACVYEVSC